MLDRVDRVLITNADAAAAAGRWVDLLDAEIVATNVVSALAARRVVVAVGDAFIEVLEPTGPGPAADHLALGRGGPFAVGLSTADLAGLLAHMANAGVHGTDIGGSHYFSETDLRIPGLSVVLSETGQHTPVGLMSNLYEATHLVADAEAATAAIAERFNLDADQFVEIGSDTYGYKGSLTLFDSARLHRIETIYPYDAAKTMGRYFERFGPSLYMCYGETDHLPEIRERLKARAPGAWTGSDDDPDGLFVHPKALGGTMLGVSRTTHAWTWSGYPERRVAPD